MLADVSSLLRPLIWETDKVFALVFVLCVYMLSARIRRPLAISSNEMTFPAFQELLQILSRCHGSQVSTSRGLPPAAPTPPPNNSHTPPICSVKNKRGPHPKLGVFFHLDDRKGRSQACGD